jgi:hypothetical protein
VRTCGRTPTPAPAVPGRPEGRSGEPRGGFAALPAGAGASTGAAASSSGSAGGGAASAGGATSAGAPHIELNAFMMPPARPRAARDFDRTCQNEKSYETRSRS